MTKAASLRAMRRKPLFHHYLFGQVTPPNIVQHPAATAPQGNGHPRQDSQGHTSNFSQLHIVIMTLQHISFSHLAEAVSAPLARSRRHQRVMAGYFRPLLQPWTDSLVFAPAGATGKLPALWVFRLILCTKAAPSDKIILAYRRDPQVYCRCCDPRPVYSSINKAVKSPLAPNLVGGKFTQVTMVWTRRISKPE